jgi:outer membrane protein assembly factor BamB
MKIAKNKTAAITIAILLTLSMSASTILLPSASAHTPPYNIPTWAYISVMPNPVGVGQEAFVNFWIDKAEPTANGAYGDRWQNFTVKVTHPDGTTETLGPFTADDTGGAHTTYTPTVIGNYTFVFTFPGQTLAGSNPPPTGYSSVINGMIGDYYAPSTSGVVTLAVQQQPIPGEPTAPLPTGYWQRPIYGENLDWYTISGNWLGLAAVGFTMATGAYNASGNFNPYTTAPTSAHILWTRPLAFGGLIGGEFGGTEYGSSYYSTSQYEPKFGGIVINGVLYYQETPSSANNPAGWEALNLRTGQEIWFKNTTVPLLCGQVLEYISPNQFGGIPYLWSTGNPAGINVASGSTTYNMFDAMTGNYILSIVNGSAMTLTEDAGGDLIGYYVNTTAGTQIVQGVKVTTPTGGELLECWNSSEAVIYPSGYVPGVTSISWMWRPTQNGVIPFSSGIMWAMPLATNISGVPISPALSISSIGSNVILMTSVDSTLNGGLSWLPPWRIIAGYSSITGQPLWSPINETVGAWCRIDTYGIANGMWFEFNHETFTWTAYNANTGQLVWTAQPYTSPPWAYFINYRPIIAYGMLYASDFGGQVHAYNITNGQQVWQFSTGESGYSTPYGIWPLVHVEAVGGGEVFVAGGHTYSPPLFLGAQVYAINATTGNLVWSGSSFDDSNAASALLADGIFVKPNAYNNELYAYGQGQTATTVTTAPGINDPAQVLIKGTVTDQTPGQTCLGIPAAGTPAISDASMSAWMDYLYNQQPEPTNATGVPVTLTDIDPNGNAYTIGTTTSNIAGQYSYTFTPTIPGTYTIIATFGGSNSYYSSTAQTTMLFNQPTPVTPTAAPVTGLATTSDLTIGIAAAVIAIIIAIAIVGLLILRKKP